MEIGTADTKQRAAMLALIDAELRPADAATRVQDDFPVILSRANRGWQFVATMDDEVVGCLACLIRPFVSSAGLVAVAGIGSVVTAPAWRGRGISARLQRHALGRIAAAGVPLAVLWTDRPATYAGRGFRPAGIEYHADFTTCSLDDAQPAVGRIRAYAAEDAAAVAALYARHRLRTERAAGDAELLYGMPGTRGLVLEADGRVRAYLFGGKGADFPDYVAEFGGDEAHVLALLAAARRRGIATKLLIPQGAVPLLKALAARGAPWSVRASGLWAVVDGGRLAKLAAAAAGGIADETARDDPRTWLGAVDGDGTVREGALELAVWGFDSV